MSTKSQILKRLLILMALVFSLGWFSLADNAGDAYARPCCQSCPGFENPGEEVGYCSDQCGGATSGTCYDSCMNQVHNCYRNCYYCSGGGGGGGCLTSSDCPYMPGYGFGYCVGGNCVY